MRVPPRFGLSLVLGVAGSLGCGHGTPPPMVPDPPEPIITADGGSQAAPVADAEAPADGELDTSAPLPFYAPKPASTVWAPPL